ncbi:MAG: type II toxin-antitoxin system HicB family antitoxin [Chloroflexi bacterium]|jgi:predicted RNase H-like HicB family nuclease|nr:type II toxin-antitoxin system HicB family antitoxin [Chloroflexota bacterium]
MFKYSMTLAWSDRDECYVATIPEFPGLSAFGETPEEAANEARIAVEGFIETMLEDGEEVPAPQKVKTHSGQIRLRLPSSLHKKLAEEADREGVSLNTHMLYLLSNNYGAETATKACREEFRKLLQPKVISNIPFWE